MTTLIISDTHLTDRPEPRKLEFLLRIIKKADRIILNGDFWDGYITDIDRFIMSEAWRPLLHLLREKRAIYLYGNHDPKQAGHELVKMFSHEQHQRYELMDGGQVFHFEHGNLLAPELDATHPWFPRFVLHYGSLLDDALTWMGGHLFLRHYRWYNEKMKEWQRRHLAPHIFLICGHSHWAELRPGAHFANSGLIRGGIASYLTITDGKVKLHEGRY